MSGVPKVLLLETRLVFESTKMFQSKLLLTFSKSVEASDRTLGADSSLRWLQDGESSGHGGYLLKSAVITISTTFMCHDLGSK